MDDYKGLYFIGWGQTRGGVGSLITASGPILTRFLKLQDEINVPIGLVLKMMGQGLPSSHISDPQKIFRGLKIANFMFKLIETIAHRVDAKYPNFTNTPIINLPIFK